MKRTGYIAVFLFVTIWSMAFISSKILLEVLNPLSIIFLRYVFASLFFVGLMIYRKESFTFDKKDIPLFLSSSIIGIVLYFIAELAGLERMQASTATLILALIPLVIVIVNRFTKTEELSNTKRIAVIGSIVGVAMVVSGGSQGSDEMLGYLYMTGAVIAWVVFSFQTTPLTHKYGETKVAAIQAFITLGAFLPFFLLDSPDFTNVTWVHWSHLLFLGIISSAIGFILYNYALKVIGGTVTSLGINFIPVVTLGIGFVVLGETMNWIQLLGGLLIIVLMGFTIVEDVEEEVVVKQHE